MGWEAERQDRLARGEAGPSNHYHFCHTLLPSRVLDAAGPQFVEDLMGKRGHELLAEVWNQGCTKKTKARHFERVWTPLTDRWKAIVITPPPALGPGEAHLIGIWRDYGGSSVASEKAESATGDASSALRYFCLERGHIQGMTFVGEWLGFGNRRNLGQGPAPSPEAMVQFMAKLHGIRADFSDHPTTEAASTNPAQHSKDDLSTTQGTSAHESPTVRVSTNPAWQRSLEKKAAGVADALLGASSELARRTNAQEAVRVQVQACTRCGYANVRMPCDLCPNCGAEMSIQRGAVQTWVCGACNRRVDEHASRCTLCEARFDIEPHPSPTSKTRKPLSPKERALQQAVTEDLAPEAELPPAEPGFSMADELGKLADLRDRGVLTEEEFQEQKMKLLE